jgi:ubiquinone biosynthesis protein COQ9
MSETPKEAGADRDGAPDWAESAEQRVLDEALRLAPAEGWTRRMALRAGRAAGLSQGETELLVPHGPADLAALLARRHDARALLALRPLDPAAMKMRERMRAALEARLDAAAQDEPAERRCAGWLSLPQNAALGAKLAWESADTLWRWAGDTATDENHYSKRALLAGVLAGALAIRLSSGREASMAFVDRRIADILRFEQWKRTRRVRPDDLLAGFAKALGRLRYGRAETPAEPELHDAP